MGIRTVLELDFPAFLRSLAEIRESMPGLPPLSEEEQQELWGWFQRESIEQWNPHEVHLLDAN